MAEITPARHRLARRRPCRRRHARGRRRALPEAIVIDRDRLERIVRVVQKLPARTQSIFRLHKFDGVSHAEVAARLGISRSSVEKHMMDALRILAARMRK